MVQPAGGELERGTQIFGLEVRHLIEDLFSRQASGEEVEDVGDTNPHTANARTSSALLRIDGDPIHQLSHDGCLHSHKDIARGMRAASTGGGAERRATTAGGRLHTGCRVGVPSGAAQCAA